MNILENSIILLTYNNMEVFSVNIISKLSLNKKENKFFYLMVFIFFCVGIALGTYIVKYMNANDASNILNPTITVPSLCLRFSKVNCVSFACVIVPSSFVPPLKDSAHMISPQFLHLSGKKIRRNLFLFISSLLGKKMPERRIAPGFFIVIHHSINLCL